MSKWHDEYQGEMEAIREILLARLVTELAKQGKGIGDLLIGKQSGQIDALSNTIDWWIAEEIDALPEDK
jgi:hypothetical protein